jgi:putative transposase
LETEGFVTIVALLIYYDRTVVSSINSNYINTELAIETSEIAMAQEKPENKLILHSDQGCQVRQEVA